jgi:hypothetical protein
VNFIREADDFVITGRSRELLEEIKPLVEGFPRERGLELSPVKTVITDLTTGFDFVSQNMCRYPNGKLLTKPSRKNIQSFLEDICGTIRASLTRKGSRPDLCAQPQNTRMGQLSSAYRQQPDFQQSSLRYLHKSLAVGAQEAPVRYGPNGKDIFES